MAGQGWRGWPAGWIRPEGLLPYIPEGPLAAVRREGSGQQRRQVDKHEDVEGEVSLGHREAVKAGRSPGFGDIDRQNDRMWGPSHVGVRQVSNLGRRVESKAMH
jgi:hypothetical protein